MEVDLRRLPHWSRVAFAVRCARRVRPLFDEAWPNAGAVRTEAIDRAIELAERAVLEGQPVGELKQAMLNAVAATGAAQIPHLLPDDLHPVEMEDEPAPIDREAAIIACTVARATAKAAEAALSDPAESALPAQEAYSDAWQAIVASGRLGIFEMMEADFERCQEKEKQKPWWRFW